MKIRFGFVSNSSSASFVVALSVLTNKEINKILDWSHQPNHDGWAINICRTEETLKGWTIMDNGDLDKFLEKEGINKTKINIEEYQ